MATVTLAQAAKLTDDIVVQGVIENIVTVNEVFNDLPFVPVVGTTKSYNRELVLGDAQKLAIDGTITAKAAATTTRIDDSLTTLIGDAEVNGLLQATGMAGGDLVGQQVASKAKSVGRLYEQMMITGDKTGNPTTDFNGLANVVSAGQTIAAGGALSLGLLDQLIGKVTSQGTKVDFLMANYREMLKLADLTRTLGGTDAEWVTVNGIRTLFWAGIPVYRNDYIPTNEGVGSNESSIYAGNFDDGSESVGIVGLTSVNDFGINVDNIGPAENKDNDIWRVKFYAGFSSFSDLGLAKIDGITV